MSVWTITDTENPVTNGNNFQTKLNDCALGDTIILIAGVEYRGNFILPDKGAGTSFITIESSNFASIPFRRIEPSDAPNCPLLTTPAHGYVFWFNKRAHHWRFHGLNITTIPMLDLGISCGLLIAQDNDTNDMADMQHHYEFERCLLHPRETGMTPQTNFRTTNSCMNLDGAFVSVKRCKLYDFGGLYMGGGRSPGNVSTASNGTTCRVTLGGAYFADPVAMGHKMMMSFRGATGAWSPLNGTWIATYVNATQWDVQTYDPATFAPGAPLNSSGFGSFAGQAVEIIYTGGSGNTHIQICILKGPGPTVIEDNWIDGGNGGSPCSLVGRGGLG